MENMKSLVVIVEPNKIPFLKEMELNLKNMQKVVGGRIEALYPYKDPVGLICNEEGKILELPFNRAMRDDEGEVYDVIAGTFMVVGLTEENFGSLSPYLAVKYMLEFFTPEHFV